MKNNKNIFPSKSLSFSSITFFQDLIILFCPNQELINNYDCKNIFIKLFNKQNSIVFNTIFEEKNQGNR